MGRRALARDHRAQDDVWYPQSLELCAKPFALAIVGVDAYIHATGVIKSKGSVQCGLATGADRKWLAELLFKSCFNVMEMGVLKNAAPSKTLYDGLGCAVLRLEHR